MGEQSFQVDLQWVHNHSLFELQCIAIIHMYTTSIPELNFKCITVIPSVYYRHSKLNFNRIAIIPEV